LDHNLDGFPTENRMPDDIAQNSQKKVILNSLKDLLPPTDGMKASKSQVVGELWIQVSNPIIKETMVKKYTVYSIKGNDELGAFECQRRYSRFLILREVLRSRWPGVYIPPLPEKKMVGNLDAAFVEDRRCSLEAFMQKLQATSYLYYSEEAQLFMRGNQEDIKTALRALKPQSYEDLVSKYAATFAHLSGLELSNEKALKIFNFQLYLKKMKESFEIYKNMAKSLANAKRDYYNRLALFHKHVLIDYEEKCLTEYTNGSQTPFVFRNEQEPDSNVHIKKIEEACNKMSFEAFYKLVKMEARELEAFLEIIDNRDSYHLLRMKLRNKVMSESHMKQNILSGKKTVRTVFSRRTQYEHVANCDKIIEQTQKDIDSITILYDMMTLIIAYMEIDKFKAEKVQTYLQIAKQLCVNEQDLSMQMNTFWTERANKNVLMDISVPKTDRDILLSKITER